jgi:hypothetical protein
MDYYYSAIKKDEITSFAGKWMDLEIMMLSDMSQAHIQTLHPFTHNVEYRPKMMIIAIIIMGHEWNWWEESV